MLAVLQVYSTLACGELIARFVTTSMPTQTA